MTNADVAHILQRIAEILAIQGENPFRIRAYERAAVTIAGIPQDLAEMYERGGLGALQEIPGIGEDLAQKIVELLKTGKLRWLRELEHKVPKGLLTVMEVEGMGPKRTKFVWEEFGVRSLVGLERLCRSGRLASVRGWGEQSVRNIQQAIDMRKKFGERMPLGVALPLAEQLVRTLERSRLCDRVEIAGSIRRRNETIGDIDLLVTSAQPKRVMDLFCAFPIVARVIAKGSTKANALLTSGIEADLRVLEPEVFGAGLHYFTGSKQHNVHVRTIAMQHGRTVSEYGVFTGTKEHKGRRIACRTEEDVFRAIGLPYIPPEIREDTGEIEAALAGQLPALIGADDLRGDLHAHSDFSDGTASMEEMIAAAKRAGLTYIAITDHASVMGMVKGIKVSRFSPPPNRGGARGGAGALNRSNIGAYVKRVRAAAAKVGGIHVLAGAEVDILADGSLYLPDAVLKQLDWVIGSMHQNFKQSREVATARLLKAMENPFLHCIGHPTTRLIGKRAGMELDWESLFHRAHERGIAFELNASWMRLDLDDVRCRQAKAARVKMCINSDAHATQEFDLRYGIAQARRGWLERSDVVNALPWIKFERWRQQSR
ncbi:PHP domain-containing protein [Candidatus Uhrbacteria bacterium]|nr:PHP domain-containing protein [Candidatus Uhrbacteria bacterium]